MLSVEEVARHFGLRPDTVQRKVSNGEIEALRIGRQYRFNWRGVWACEEGPMPNGARKGRYMEPLLCKRRIARGLGVSAETIERWIAVGLPTRNVFGAVRSNPHDVEDWLKLTMGIKLPADWWK